MSTIHVHASGEAGIFANAYIVETAKSLVAIDATLTVSEAKAFGAKLAALGKPLAAVLITHAHPDHVAGLAVWLKETQTPIYALPSVTRLLRQIEEPKRAQWQPVFQDEWVSAWLLPNTPIGDGESVTVDEATFRVHELGRGGDCDANSVWVMSGDRSAAFVGDVVFNGTHSYLADGHASDWLRNLDRVRAWIPKGATIYPGHGEPGSAAVLDSQADYLVAYREAVRRLAGGKPQLDEAQTQRLVATMERLVPGGRLAFMIGLSANAVAAELARESQRQGTGVR